jgi:hypothetical protein
MTVVRLDTVFGIPSPHVLFFACICMSQGRKPSKSVEVGVYTPILYSAGVSAYGVLKEACCPQLGSGHELPCV